MINPTKWLAVPVLVAAGFLFAADAPTASAQHGYGGSGFNLSIGHGGFSIGTGSHGSYRPNYCAPSRSHSAYRSYSTPYRSRSYNSNFGHGGYHDTSHYDYHPTEIRRHGNHYDVTPGHYDYHRTGHFH